MEIKHVSFAYGKNLVIRDISFQIKEHKITTLMGANGCGKSTMFSLMTKNLKPGRGAIFHNGKNIQDIRLKDFAKQVAIVHQNNSSSRDITVEQLVSFGRTPYRVMGKRETEKDREKVRWAMEAANVEKYKDKAMSTLSGGQRQRVWIAMALAQDTKMLLLDEPTTYLDIRYQIEILDLIRELNRKYDLTVVMVLHDINQAIAYSDEVIGMKDGTVLFQGAPEDVITRESMDAIYGIEMDVEEIHGQRYVLTMAGRSRFAYEKGDEEKR